MAVVLAGCGGDPMRDVPRLADVDLAQDAGQADVLAPEADAASTLPTVAVAEDAPRRGLLGFLKRKADEAGAAPAPAPVVILEADAAAEAMAERPVSAADTSGAAAGVVDPAADAIVAAAPEAEPTRRRLFGLFGRKAGSAPPETEPQAGVDALIAADEPAVDLPADEVVLAGLPAADIPADLPAEQPRRGLFGGSRKSAAGASAGSAPKPGAPDFREVAFGTTIPYGEVARVCGVSDAGLGKTTQTWPERGRGYAVHDSAPGAKGARTMYLTGFKDGCARQITAALVVFGAPETWEQIHYGPAGDSLPILSTDRAFEEIKALVCRVGQGKSCGSKMGKLEEDTVFVSFYERFEDNTRWTNILLHDGEVVALDGKR